MKGAQLPGQVRDAFAAIIAEGIDARIDAVNTHTHEPEFSVVIVNPGGDRIGGHGYGLLHEEILTLVGVAEAHDARLWFQFDEEPCLLWARAPIRGPGTPDDDSPQERVERLARDGAAKTLGRRAKGS